MEIQLLKTARKVPYFILHLKMILGGVIRFVYEKKSDKKTGGQLGHKGSTLQMSSTPAEIINYKNEYH